MIEKIHLSDATRERLDLLCGDDAEKIEKILDVTIGLVETLGTDLAENLLLTELEIVRDLKLNLRGNRRFH